MEHQHNNILFFISLDNYLPYFLYQVLSWGNAIFHWNLGIYSNEFQSKYEYIFSFKKTKYEN